MAASAEHWQLPPQYVVITISAINAWVQGDVGQLASGVLAGVAESTACRSPAERCHLLTGLLQASRTRASGSQGLAGLLHVLAMS